jgi:hypothetical protein
MLYLFCSYGTVSEDLSKMLKVVYFMKGFCSSQGRKVVFQLPSLEWLQCDTHLNLLKHHIAAPKPFLDITRNKDEMSRNDPNFGCGS